MTRPKIPHWILHFGLAGIFGVALLDASPIPIPIPGSADLLILIFAAGRENPILLVAVGVIGSSIGAFLSWAAGEKGGEEILQRRVPKRIYSRVRHFSKKYGAFSVFLAAFAPPPLPMLPFLLAAGAGGVKARSAMPAFVAARVIRFGLEAYLGMHYGKQILSLWSKYESSTAVHALFWTLVGLVVLGVSFAIWKLFRERRSKRSGK